MTVLDNVMLITIQGLKPFRPTREEWTSFGELCGKWAANAKTNRHAAFWLMSSEHQAQNAVCLAGIEHIMETHGHAVGAWILSYLREMQRPTLDGLTELAEMCPDESILPLALPEPMRDLLGSENLREARRCDAKPSDRRAG